MATSATLAFTSVFPHSTAAHTTPTPQATPELGVATEGQPFGLILETGPLAVPTASRSTRQPRQSIRSARQLQSQQQQPELSRAQREVQRNLAWSTATQFLSLHGTRDVPLQRHADSRRSRQVDEALRLLLNRGDDGAPRHQDRFTSAPGSGALLHWYLEDVKEHFNDAYLPTVRSASHAPRDGSTSKPLLLLKDLEMLVAAMTLYMTPVTNHMLLVGDVDSKAKNVLERVAKDSIVSVLLNSSPHEDYQASLTSLMLECARIVLQLPRTWDRIEPSALMTTLSRCVECYDQLELRDDAVQTSLAAATDRVMAELVASDRFKVDWFAQQSVVPKLRACIQTTLADLFVRILSRDSLRHSQDGQAASLTAEDIQRWSDMAVVRLARSRLHDLFDFVIRWDMSRGAVMDLKEFIGIAGARAEVVQNFQEQLHRRLLHAGATTVQILDTYVFTIKTFTELDPKGVLLDRIARPIRRYLKDREDTTRIIIASLLTDVNEEAAYLEVSDDISVQIAKQMQDTGTGASNEHDVDLDWDNMDWTPDPHDAGPEYRRSKTEDVLSSLLSLYNREDFIGELRNIFGDHLLKIPGHDLEREIRLLEMFKSRLGEDKLQAAEVMLHDIEESRHINTSVHADESYKASHLQALEGNPAQDSGAMDEAESSDPVQLSARIVSSYFWPVLRNEPFKVPSPVARQQSGFDVSFRTLKDMRRLQWLQELGTAVVELQLADREIEVECTTFQASVIYAFDDNGGDDGDTARVQHSVDSLAESLDMDESLVTQAVAFWVSKLVLTEMSAGSGTYTVLERLPTSDDAAEEAEAVAIAAAEAAQAAARTSEDLLLEKMQMYRQFVLGMLTNQGKMDAARMLMMLRMVVPGGFGFSVEELRVLLRRLTTEGLVTVDGDTWTIVK